MGSSLVASSMVVSQSPFSHAAGQSAPPQLEPHGQEAMPATRGDMTAVVAELRGRRGVLAAARAMGERRRLMADLPGAGPVCLPARESYDPS